ncbi:transposable element Tcb1 transposase [Trichonephila clavipes]|nr:transposable element Tcb1 transposase [Trichonephila clavipes]
MNETTQQEKTTQLSSRNEQLNSCRNETTQLNREKTTQLVSRNETTQLCTAVDRLQPPTTAYNRLQPPATACNHLQPPATAYNRLHRLHRLHRLYSRIGFFYLLSDNLVQLFKKELLVPTVKRGGVMESATKLGLGSSFCFQHDNDPKHTTEIVKLWPLYNVPNQLHTPRQSPDLIPIEHLWDLLERKIRQHNISSKDILKSVLKDEWEKISAEETTNLVDLMPKRLQEVLERHSVVLKQ